MKANPRFKLSNRLKGINFLVIMVLLISSCKTKDNQISDVNVTFISNIDNDPYVSYQIDDESGEYSQSASQIIISDSKKEISKENGNILDTGKKDGSKQSQIKLDAEFIPGERYFISIRIWDQKGNPSGWSKPLTFYAPINYPADWQAEWITYDYEPGSALPVFRKPFKIENIHEIEYVRFYIAAPGYYEAYLNGEKIGENVLDPGQTNYEDYTYYTEYFIDLADLNDENVLGVMPGNGWYNQNVVWNVSMIYGQPVFIAQMVIHYKDGEKKHIASEKSWKWKSGPFTFSNIYAGDYYDANLEVSDWFEFETAEGSDWKEAQAAENHPTMLFRQFSEPIRKVGTLKTEKIIDNSDGKYIFDFGQNFAGWTKLSIRGQKGQEIVIRFAEELDDENRLDPTTTGVLATKVVQTSKYICKGEGLETWEPKFTYHGFRYAEVSGLNSKPEPDLLTGIVVHSDLPESGSFKTSEENINKLHELSVWTLKGNIHSIPTDCPHREKCGWTGDAHALSKALIYNFNSQKFMSKYMFDMRSSGREEKRELYFGEGFHDRSIVLKPEGIPTMIVPGRRTSGIASPDWGTALVQLPWDIYLYYGDRVMLRNFYPDMKRWVQYIESKKEDGLILHGLGDWCPPGGNENIDTPVPVSSTAFHILDVKIMKDAAEILDLKEDQEYYSGLLEELKEDFNRKFLDMENFTYGSQTANAMALHIGITPDSLKTKVAASILRNMDEQYDGFINTGIFGLPRIFQVLAENGFEEDVYRILTKKGRNSFAFMWEEYDATTLWEVLPLNDNYDQGVYKSHSHSHPMQAGFDAWFYSGIAGINPVKDSPGFKKIVFKPYLTQQINSAEATYESVYGAIYSAWKSDENSFSWEVTIPANSFGEIYVPVYGNEIEVSVNDKNVEPGKVKDDFAFIGNYESGSYVIECENVNK